MMKDHRLASADGRLHEGGLLPGGGPHGERISLRDGSLYAAYCNHIVRYEFAAEFCRGGSVLDAGCGTGYGSAYLAAMPDTRVLAVDLSDEALEEARLLYARTSIDFQRADVENLDEHPEVKRRGPFNAIVNFENIEHLPHPERMLRGCRSLLADDGVFLTSTPNGDVAEILTGGHYATSKFHVREFTPDEFRTMLGAEFGSVELYGQWRTPAAVQRERWYAMLYGQVVEQYYSPVSRAVRALRRMLGKATAPPPEFLMAGASAPGDYVIRPLEDRPHPWAPRFLVAVCRV